MNISGRVAAGVAMALLLAGGFPAASQGGGVSVAPMMVILDTRGRPVSFDVINFGSRTATFRLDPLHAVIDAEGVQQLQPAETQPGSAVSFLRWAPRQFEVPPGATRTVRLSARPPVDLPAGEYRLHLRVTNVGAAPDRPTTTRDRGLGVNINIEVAQAVRVLVRHGVGPGTARLEGVNVQSAEGGVQVRFVLSNNHDGGSVLGRYALVVAAPDGSERVLRETDVTLYPDTDQRPVRVDLPPGDVPAGSRACIRFWSGRGGGPSQQSCSTPAGARVRGAEGADVAGRAARGA